MVMYYIMFLSIFMDFFGDIFACERAVISWSTDIKRNALSRL